MLQSVEDVVLLGKEVVVDSEEGGVGTSRKVTNVVRGKRGLAVALTLRYLTN